MNPKYRAGLKISNNFAIYGPVRDSVTVADFDADLIFDQLNITPIVQSINADGTWETLDYGMIEKLKEQGE